MGLGNNCVCRKCGNEEETSVHILCECETLASLSYTYLSCFFLGPEDIIKLIIGAMDWIGLAQDRGEWRRLVSAVMNLRVP